MKLLNFTAKNSLSQFLQCLIFCVKNETDSYKYKNDLLGHFEEITPNLSPYHINVVPQKMLKGKVAIFCDFS